MKALPSHHHCPITRVLEVVGERWSFFIVRDVFYGIRRFDALQHHLGISKKVLANRLTHLQQEGVFKKVPYQQRPERFEYRLTIKGRELFPVLMTMMCCGKRWSVGEADETHHDLIHINCGKIVDPKLVCGHCEQPLSPAKVHLK